MAYQVMYQEAVSSPSFSALHGLNKFILKIFRIWLAS